MRPLRPLLLLAFVVGLPWPAAAQVELANPKLRKRQDLTWDVAWNVDVINRGPKAVEVRVRATFLDEDGFAIATSTGKIQVAARDTVTYRAVGAYTPASWEAIVRMEVKAALVTVLRGVILFSWRRGDTLGTPSWLSEHAERLLAAAEELEPWNGELVPRVPWIHGIPEERYAHVGLDILGIRANTSITTNRPVFRT